VSEQTPTSAEKVCTLGWGSLRHFQHPLKKFAHWGWDAQDISSIHCKRLHTGVGNLETFPAPLKKFAQWGGEP
jgi:hypothetical protein